MQNKSPFVIIVLAIALAGTYFFYQQKNQALQTEIAQITQEYNAKLGVLSDQAQAEVDRGDISALESLNNQLIQTRSELQKAQKALARSQGKTHVLGDEIKQISDARGSVNTLKAELSSTQEQLKLSAEKLNLLQQLFKEQNTQQIDKNIARITQLKESSVGIAATGLIVPVVGAATLASYAIEEIDNYCANIENTLKLEKQVFGQVVSMNDKAQQDYHNQCVVTFKEKLQKRIKAGLEQVKPAQ